MVLLGGRKYNKKNVKEGKGFFSDMFRKGRNYITDKLYKRNPVFNFVRNPNLPSNKLLQEIAEDSYNKIKKPFIGEYVNIFKNDTLNIYLNKDLKIIIIGVRGTASGADGIADLKIANGNLNTSTRYKNDLQNIKKIQKIYSIAEYKYFGSGHSLAGAILDLLIRGGYIRQAVSYNPAVEKNEMGNSKNLRIYNEDDALYNLLGKYSNNVELRKNKNKISNPIINTLNAHKMEQFEGGMKKIKLLTPKQRKLKTVFDRMTRKQLIDLVRDYNLQEKIIGYYRHPKSRLIYIINKYMKMENGHLVNRNDGEAVKYDEREKNPEKLNVDEEIKEIKEEDKKKAEHKEKKRLERNEKAKQKRKEKKEKENKKKQEEEEKRIERNQKAKERRQLKKQEVEKGQKKITSFFDKEEPKPKKEMKKKEPVKQVKTKQTKINFKKKPKKEKMTIDDLLRLDMNEPEFSKERLEFYKKNNDVIKKFLLKFVKKLPTTIRKNLLIGSYGKDIKKDTERIEFLKKKVEKNPRKVIEEIIMYEDYGGDIYDEIVEFFEKLM